MCGAYVGAAILVLTLLALLAMVGSMVVFTGGAFLVIIVLMFVLMQ